MVDVEEFEDGLEGCGNEFGFRCWEAGDPGAMGTDGFAECKEIVMNIGPSGW